MVFPVDISDGSSGGLGCREWNRQNGLGCALKGLRMTIAVRTGGANFAPGLNGSQGVCIDDISYLVLGSLDLMNFDQVVSFVSKSAQRRRTANSIAF
jgi:hypothetical protein